MDLRALYIRIEKGESIDTLKKEIDTSRASINLDKIYVVNGYPIVCKG